MISITEHEYEYLLKARDRYETVRKLNPREFSEVWTTTITTGSKFDDLIDQRYKKSGEVENG